MRSKVLRRLHLVPCRSFAGKPHSLGQTITHPPPISLAYKGRPVNTGFHCTARFQGDFKDVLADNPLLKGKWKVMIFGNWDTVFGRYGSYPASHFDNKAKEFEDHNCIVIFPYYEHGTSRTDMARPLSVHGYQLDKTYIIDPDHICRYIEPCTTLPNDLNMFLEELLKCQKQYEIGYVD